jgi:hypothetical protein
METQGAPDVISVDRFRRGVVIAFDDGKCALYSSDLLHGTFPQAEEWKETDSERHYPKGTKRQKGPVQQFWRSSGRTR